MTELHPHGAAVDPVAQSLVTAEKLDSGSAYWHQSLAQKFHHHPKRQKE